ncbi:MAG: hypothetical protein ACI86H_002517 [bacterium]|jgi:hypothetical protein
MNQEGIQLFFEKYAQTFENGNSNEIAEFYHFPSIFYVDKGPVVFRDIEAFGKNVERLMQLYKKFGVQSVKFEILNLSDMNPISSLVELKWFFLDENHALITDFTTKYILQKSEEQLKIVSVFVIDEPKKIKELQL